MSDLIDRVNAREAQVLALQLASRLSPPPSKEEIEEMVLKGRECIDCGSAIVPERIRAAPFARRCIGCQTKYEEHKR